jgi:biuret amidohydrolase
VTPPRFFQYEGYAWSEPVSLTRSPSTALLIIDMQYQCAAPDCGAGLMFERISPGSMTYFNWKNETLVIPTIGTLLAYFREHDLPVVYVKLGSEFRDLRDLTPRLRRSVRRFEKEGGVDDILWSGTHLFDIRSEIAPLPTELVVNKTSLGAFNSTDLESALNDRGVETLVITGVSTNACVETTARDAADRGFACVIVDEGTADYDKEAHDSSLLAFHFNFGRVMTSAGDVIAALEESVAPYEPAHESTPRG